MSATEPPHPSLISRGPIASVRPGWRDWHVAHVPIVDLSDLHWDHILGDADARPAAAILHGFVRCDSVLAGELPHLALGGPHPHSVRVCILKEDNDRRVFARLALEAAGQPHGRGSAKSG